MEQQEPGTSLDRKGLVTRRRVLGGALAAGSVAAAYAALGGRFDLFTSDGSSLSPQLAAADADALKSESVRISHLLRRAGFGLTREEHDRYQSLGLEKTLDEVINYQQVDDAVAEDLAAQITIDPSQRAIPIAWWLVRIANTKRPLQEKMTLFWHGLLTSQISEVKDPTAMVAQNEFFRAHAMDAFPDILKGISRDRAMMTYLDIDGSSRQAPNENYARELMELFALGIGNYTEEDVREASRAFTGWNVPRNRIEGPLYTLAEPVFRQQRYDNGTKTVLGQTGNFGPDEIVDVITSQPASGEHIVRKLFGFFIYPDASDDDIRPFVQVYESNGKRIGAVVEAMLRSEVFYSPAAYRATIKSPVEYAVSAVKALGLQGQVTQLLAQAGQRGATAGALSSMGQTLFEPPNVAGWPGGATWLNSSTMFARLNFLNAATGGATTTSQQRRTDRRNAPAATPTPDVPSQALGTVEQAIEHYLPFLLDDNIPADARQTLLDYAGDGELAPERLRGLVYLVLGSPQFHLS
jgi:uncharacterized protein (DUF1800 family)